VSHEAPDLLTAVEGAANKLKRSLEHAIARRERLPGPTPREGDIAGVDELEALEKDQRK
jgi:hypothetical protein